jgi:2-hydroxycyclohexanecarboxyl-CoA dehydrogenase
MNPLEGKTVLITGGTAGIGRACAEAMLAAGAEAVVINGRNRERGERALAAIGRFSGACISLVLGDMAQVADAQAVVDAAVEKLGRIDILVNSTGTNDFPALLHNIATEDVPGIIQRCLLAQLLSCRAVLPHMRKANAGCIINIASDAAKIPTPAKA